LRVHLKYCEGNPEQAAEPSPAVSALATLSAFAIAAKTSPPKPQRKKGAGPAAPVSSSKSAASKSQKLSVASPELGKQMTTVMKRFTPQTTTTEEVRFDSTNAKVQQSWMAQKIAVYIKTSGDGRGQGAYASRVFLSGEFVGEYTGKVCKEATLVPTNRYVFQLGDGMAVDGSCGPWNDLRYMNHSDTGPNIRAVIVNHLGVRRIAIYAKTHIPKGQELLIDYQRT